MATLIHGECLEVMREMPDDSVDSIITDPPYGLGYVKEISSLLVSWIFGEDGKEYVGSSGFMNKKWDKCVPPPAVWKECLRILKPGGHMLVFTGTRTYDLMGISIRLAGAELRDEITCLGQVTWAYGCGMPKGLDISKTIDREAGQEREVVGVHLRRGGGSPYSNSMGKLGTDSVIPLTAPSTDTAKQWVGWHTSLKPAHENILVFRKALSESTVASNVIKHGTGSLNIDASRVVAYDAGDSTPSRRFPSNLILGHHPDCDESGCHPDCPVGQMPFSSSGSFDVSQRKAQNKYTYGKLPKNPRGTWSSTSGSAARFFYTSKASPMDKNEGLGDTENVHCSVKPTDLMRYLCKLVTPPGGTVLDPFMGSGSTGKGAVMEGFRFIGVEVDECYYDIARKRIDFVEDEDFKEVDDARVSE